MRAEDALQMAKAYTRRIVFGMGAYSTDEQVVGTWIDGSTIYRKVIEVSNIAEQTTLATVKLGEAVSEQYIIKIEGFFNLIGNQFFINYPNVTGRQNGYIDATVSVDGSIVNLTGTWKYPIGKGVIIIEYIKK